MQSVADKRKDKRLPCLVPVDSKSGGPFDHTQTFDISKRGLGFISDHKIPLNKKIAIELDLYASGDPVVVVGRVKWARPINGTSKFKIGLYFESLLQGKRSQLSDYFNE